MHLPIAKLKANKKGFTLVEMITYIAIFSVILFVIVQLFWQVQISSIRSKASSEVKENVAQIVEIFKYNIRGADDIYVGDSVFNTHPGILSIQNESTIIIDTYTKDVILDGRSNTIRKLRYKKGSDPSVDLSSDRVNVENFVVRNLTQGVNPNNIKMELTISYLNPEDDYLYDQSISINTSALVRKEI